MRHIVPAAYMPIGIKKPTNFSVAGTNASLLKKDKRQSAEVKKKS